MHAVVTFPPDNELGLPQAVPYRPGRPVAIPDVPFGSERRLFIELRETTSTTSAVRFAGRSPPFDVVAGRRAVVDVPLGLDFAPELLSVEARPAKPGGFVAQKELELRVQARGVSRLVVAQDLARTLTVEAFDAELARQTDGSEGCEARLYTVPYDLEPERPCLDGACDGLRTVYVRAENDGGAFDQLTRPVELVLDTVPPRLVDATVRLDLPPGAPIDTAGAAAANGLVRVSIRASEVLSADEPPELVARGPQGFVMPFARVVRGDADARFEAMPTDAAPDGSYTLEVQLVDRAANAVTETLPTPLSVLTSTPSLRVDQGRIAYLRARDGYPEPVDLAGVQWPAGPLFALVPAEPWTSTPTVGADAVTFRDGRRLVRLEIWADAERRLLLGRAEPSADGAWAAADLRLASVDAPQVWLTGADTAGNVSAPVQVRRVWHLATSGDSSSSTRVLQVGRAGPERVPALEIVRRFPGLRAPDADVEQVQAAYEWIRRGPFRRSAARAEHRLSFDLERQRVITWNGDVYAFGPAQWERIDRALGPAPGARAGYGLTYDAVEGRVLLFGGTDGNRARGELWAWGESRWTRMDEDVGAAPEARTGAALTYDAARDRTLLFGGRADDGSALSDLWIWDGTSRAWSEIELEAGPGALGSPRAAYDAQREVVVLVGVDPTTNAIESWSWDGAKLERRLEVTRSEASVAVAVDSARGVWVLVAGDASAVRVFESDGDAWRAVESPEEPSPPGRRDFAVVYDPALRQVVMDGGRTTESRFVGDTWGWDGTRWVELARTESPPARRRAAMWFDATRKETVIGGGEGRDDAWTWNGAGWRSLDWDPPVAVELERAAFDTDRGVLVVLDTPGTNATWEWDRDRWRRRATVGPPGPRTGFRMAYNPVQAEVAMFGGTAPQTEVHYDDLWSWDGVAWTEQSQGSVRPGGRERFQWGFDPRSERLVLHGGLRGNGTRNDQWSWDGAGWTLERPQLVDPIRTRFESAVVTISRLDRLLLYGGRKLVGGTDFDDLLERREFGGVSVFVFATTTEPPKARFGHSMAYDAVRDRAVVFGGRVDDVDSDELWELAPPGRPALQLETSLGPTVSRREIETIEIHARCGGQSGSDDELGAALWGWEVGGWRRLQQNDSGLDTGPLVFVTRDPTAARRLLRRSDRAISVQCRSVGDSGVDAAQVAADFIELRVLQLLESALP